MKLNLKIRRKQKVDYFIIHCNPKTEIDIFNINYFITQKN